MRFSNWSRLSRLRVAAAGVVLIAVVLRFHDLGAAAVHYDESVHGLITTDWVQTGSYQYNNWTHGPLQFYLTRLAIGLGAPVSITTGRAVIATMSLLSFLALFLLRDTYEHSTLLAAGIVLAAHPYVLIMARTFRNEALVVSLLLLTIAAWSRHSQTRSLHTAVLAGLAAGGAVAAKETAWIFLPILLSVLLVIFLTQFVTSGGASNLGTVGGLVLASVSGIAVAWLLYSGWPLTVTGILEAPWTFFDGVDYWISPQTHTNGATGGSYIPTKIFSAPILFGLAVVGSAGTVLRWHSEPYETWLFLGWLVVATILFTAVLKQAPRMLTYLAAPAAILAGRGVMSIVQFMGDREASTARQVLVLRGAIVAVLLLATVGTVVAGPSAGDVGGVELNRPHNVDEAVTVANDQATRLNCSVASPSASNIAPHPGHWYFKNVGFERYSDEPPKSVIIAETPQPVSASYQHAVKNGYHVYWPETGC